MKIVMILLFLVFSFCMTDLTASMGCRSCEKSYQQYREHRLLIIELLKDPHSAIEQPLDGIDYTPLNLVSFYQEDTQLLEQLIARTKNGKIGNALRNAAAACNIKGLKLLLSHKLKQHTIDKAFSAAINADPQFSLPQLQTLLLLLKYGADPCSKNIIFEDSLKYLIFIYAHPKNETLAEEQIQVFLMIFELLLSQGISLTAPVIKYAQEKQVFTLIDRYFKDKIARLVKIIRYSTPQLPQEIARIIASKKYNYPLG